MARMSGNLAASIHARLLNRAEARGEEFNLVLTRYAIERFLYRLSILPARECTLDTAQLGDAIAATFQRRATPIPVGVPLGLSDEFAQDSVKRAQWLGFLCKNRLGELALEDVVDEVRRFVEAPMAQARKVLARV